MVQPDPALAYEQQTLAQAQQRLAPGATLVLASVNPVSLTSGSLYLPEPIRLEGGAGTFSDGKLYSQIKDPRHLGRKVMQIGRAHV